MGEVICFEELRSNRSNRSNRIARYLPPPPWFPVAIIDNTIVATVPERMNPKQARRIAVLLIESAENVEGKE